VDIYHGAYYYIQRQLVRDSADFVKICATFFYLGVRRLLRTCNKTKTKPKLKTVLCL